jgi:putative endonuclease
MDGRATTGRTGEDAAARWYAERGYTLVARNWRCRLGELDLIAHRGGVLVFCEVKTRRGAAYGPGFEAVHARKRAKLRALADAFLIGEGVGASGMRFDVASVALGAAGSTAVEVFEDAF